MKGLATRPWWPVTGWAILIFATSCTVVSSKQFVHSVASTSPLHVTDEQFGAFWRSWWWLFVKGWHVLEFAVLSVLSFHCLTRSGTRLKSQALLLSFAATMVYAATDEYHQSFVPKRGGRLTDWLIDGIGAVLALALSTWWQSHHGTSGAGQSESRP